MDRSTPQLQQQQQQQHQQQLLQHHGYCSEETEFSLPEGVDLVEIDNVRKLATPYHQQHHQNRKNKGPGWKAAVKLVVINLFVCALVLGYALVGSFVFLHLENNKGGGSGLPHQTVQVSASGYPVRTTRPSNLSLAIYSNLQDQKIQQLKSDTVNKIWDITVSMNVLYPDNWTKMTSDEVGNFQRYLVESILSVVENATVEELPYSWTFPRAFLFALTTLTTIGYGGIGPKTSSAKIATMIYAVFGIPIMIWYLSNVGSLLAKITRFICAKLCCCCCSRDSKGCSSASSSTISSMRKISDPYYHHYMKSGAASDGSVVGTLPGGGNGLLGSSVSSGTLNRDHLHHHSLYHHGHHLNPQQVIDELEKRHDEPRVSILVILFLCLAILLTYVCVGSYIVTKWEKWHFLDSFYFCFLTLTTISFGDSRAQQNGGLERLTPRTEWFCSFYILFGMALTSMFFNILHEEISHRIKRWKSSTSSLIDTPTAITGSLVDTHHHKEPMSTTNTLQKNKRRPNTIENSYSVHFMNFSSATAASRTPTATRNYTEESLVPNDIHSKRVGGAGANTTTPDAVSDKNLFDDEQVVTTDYIVNHPIPPPRDIYGSHTVFPR